MAKIQYRDIRFSQKILRLLDKVVSIVEEYQAQGIRLTLRQLYYQLVARGLIPNRLNEYNRLIRLTRDGRYCGLIDWEAIEDRVRIPQTPNEFAGLPDLVEAAARSYRLDRWEGQDYYVELFTEKDALSSVLAPIADKWHITFCVNRGYGSTTAYFDTSRRACAAINSGKEPVILYLGDHDPSGLDMVRDIKGRLTEFCYPTFGMLKTFGGFAKDAGYDLNGFDFIGASAEFITDLCGIRVEHIALTTEQVQQYDLPPNPAKFTDTRAAEYIEEYGRQCWEVDALRPEVLNQLVNDAISTFVDVEKMNAVIEKEDADKQRLKELACGLDGKNEA